MKTICVIGNFSGRNAGDNAILEVLLNDVYSINQDVEFLVPTINKSFIEDTYKRFPVKAVPMMPWNLSIKIFGFPIFNAVAQSDLVLVTDAILFDKSLWNPLFNYLSTMALVLPKAKKKGIPVVLYNMSLGPVTTALGKICLQRVLNSCERVIVRDRESVELLKRLSIVCNNIELNADCALNTPLPSEERMKQIKTNESIIEEKDLYLGFNINPYIDTFMKGKEKGIGTECFVQIIAETMDRIVEEMSKKILLVVTQQMDARISGMVLEKMKHRQSVTLITNKKYTHNEIAGILSEVEIHVGMRTHSLILASSTCTPTVSITYRPKNLGFMKTLGLEERTIDFGENFTSENLFKLIQKTWVDRKEIREHLRPIIEIEKEKARRSANFLVKYL